MPCSDFSKNFVITRSGENFFYRFGLNFKNRFPQNLIIYTVLWFSDD